MDSKNSHRLSNTDKTHHYLLYFPDYRWLSLQILTKNSDPMIKLGILNIRFRITSTEIRQTHVDDTTGVNLK